MNWIITLSNKSITAPSLLQSILFTAKVFPSRKLFNKTFYFTKRNITNRGSFLGPEEYSWSTSTEDKIITIFTPSKMLDRMKLNYNNFQSKSVNIPNPQDIRHIVLVINSHDIYSTIL